MEVEKNNSNIELVDYQNFRMSLGDSEQKDFVMKENGNCEGFLELQVQNVFCKRFFILDLKLRKFSFYSDYVMVRLVLRMDSKFVSLNKNMFTISYLKTIFYDRYKMMQGKLDQ